MVGKITANELKVKGISTIDAMVTDSDGVIITVRGVDKYILLPVEKYNELREMELDYAIQESRKEIEQGNYYSGSIEEHLKRTGNV